jgi:hypothetical protein
VVNVGQAIGFCGLPSIAQAKAVEMGPVGNLRGGWLPPPVRCERGRGLLLFRKRLGSQ